MARVKIILEMDGGADMIIVERSATPLTGGVQAAALVQAAYLKIMGGLGLTSATTEQETHPPPADTTGTEKKP